MINASIYDKLVQIARERRTITIAELASAGDVSMSGDDDLKNLGFMLDEIADQEIAAGRPLLPVVVVHESNNMPGAGLFRYAKRKGLQKKKDDLTFFAEELNRVHAHWAVRG